MTTAHATQQVTPRPPSHDNIRGGPRTCAEPVATTAIPVAIWPHAILLAAATIAAWFAWP